MSNHVPEGGLAVVGDDAAAPAWRFPAAYVVMVSGDLPMPVDPGLQICNGAGLMVFLIAGTVDWTFTSGPNQLTFTFTTPGSGNDGWPNDFSPPLVVSDKELWIYNFCSSKTNYQYALAKKHGALWIDPSIDNRPPVAQ